MSSENVGMSRNPRAMTCAEQDIRLEIDSASDLWNELSRAELAIRLEDMAIRRELEKSGSELLGSCYDDDLWDDWYDDWLYDPPSDFAESSDDREELSCYDPCEDRDYTSY